MSKNGQGGQQHYQQPLFYQHQPRYDYRRSPRRYLAQSPPPVPGAPIHQSHHLPLQQPDTLERRDYSSRIVAPATIEGNNEIIASTSSVTIMDCDSNAGKAYSTHNLDQQHHHASSSSLRPSYSSQDMMPSDLSHNEHYIYVTYPPDLKKRLYEKYE